VGLGLALGFLGVLAFSFSLPLTRMAVGSEAAPQLSGWFVSLGRAAVAGVLSALWLWAVRAAWPTPAQWRTLALVAAGVVFAFPVCTSLALRQVEAVHASVMLGVMPLATAVLGAWLARQRPSAGFWACAVLGSALVVGFALLRFDAGNGAGFTLALHPADGLLLLAMLGASVGYAYGARLSGHMPPEQVICWALVLSLPVTVPALWWSAPAQPAAISAAAWGGFAYVSVCSMWLGFFAWYRGLALGGTVRVSQVQLLQPFMSMVFAVPLLGEHIDAMTLGFALAVIATVFIGRKMPVHPLKP
jgi:drug/metabolite transporter (DMT)-like permease